METISLFLNSFIQLAERIINLEKTRREDKQQVFKEIIEPLFVQFQPVAENYIMIFRKAKQDFVDIQNDKPSKSLDEIVNYAKKCKWPASRFKRWQHKSMNYTKIELFVSLPDK